MKAIMGYESSDEDDDGFVLIECAYYCGNGEIIADLDRYLSPHEGDRGDEAVAECPKCAGRGFFCEESLPAVAAKDG